MGFHCIVMPRKVVLIITLFLLADFMCAQDHEFTNAQHDDAIYIESTDTKWHDLLASYGLHRPHGSGPAFDSFMTGCSKRYGTDLCHQRDKERLTLNLNQPRHQTNFTFAGYAKVKAPAKTFSILSDYWTKHNTTEANRKEDWDDANIYVNHWETETHVLPIDGLSSTERKLMIHQVRDVLEQWTSTQLLPSSVYGIRSYHNGSVLAPHVDRIPLVISAIINVAQDVTADWILQVFSHDGHTKNVTMAPGEMLLYESHSIIHGRPFALKGNFYASMFFHFEPMGYTEQLERKMISATQRKSAKRLFEQAFARQSVADFVEPKTRSLPRYIHEDSEEAKMWRQEYAFDRDESTKSSAPKYKAKVKGVTNAHVVAANGSMEQFRQIAEKNPEALFLADGNGWKPLHEASRGGQTELVEYLLKKGADVNERTNGGKGANSLWWAQQTLAENHPVILLLLKYGGVAIGPHE